MKIKTLISGSKGNCSILIEEKTKVIIDIGIGYLKLKKQLSDEDMSIDDFDGLLITHAHSDHIKGLSVLTKNTNIKVFIPQDMYDELKPHLYNENIEFIDDKFNIGNITIDLIHTSHDTKSSVGYIFSSFNKSIVYVTDTGYINRKYLAMMKNKDIYIIESNHDEEMLMDGPYPYYLKQRVVSDTGHLSNHTTAKYLKKIVGSNTKHVVLAHISEKNNTEELAIEESRRVLDSSIKLIAARQNEESPYIEV